MKKGSILMSTKQFCLFTISEQEVKMSVINLNRFIYFCLWYNKDTMTTNIFIDHKNVVVHFQLSTLQFFFSVLEHFGLN